MFGPVSTIVSQQGTIVRLRKVEPSHSASDRHGRGLGQRNNRPKIVRFQDPKQVARDHQDHVDMHA